MSGTCSEQELKCRRSDAVDEPGGMRFSSPCMTQGHANSSASQVKAMNGATKRVATSAHSCMTEEA
jgi:hypothetical protein